ncbi:MAG: tyrosine-protein phosphatase [Pleurocapsa minor GSE-CHR-MK-17-07R]|jgi:protein-tyrosine phosphatase|nr:tyrosine-protein phosphatase [Pleurocapsa minor GSE-CHR-MK 17-07R]
METVTASRWVTLSGATNVRDLGGYQADTGITRWGTLFRADGMHRLNEDDQRALINRGVRTMIDLRHASEIAAQPNVFARSSDVRYLNIPILRAVHATPDASQIPDMATIYRYFIDECQAGLSETLSAIADADQGAVVFHCTAGKDRTGVVAALLLGLAGVGHDDIADDYALTAEAMQHLLPQMMEQAKQNGSTEVLKRLLSSNREDMLDLLAYTEQRYESIPAYIRQLGLSDAQRARLRGRLLDQP